MSKKDDNHKNMEKLEKNLIENLGFSRVKARVYLAVLEAGEVKASDIAKKAKLKRTTCYGLLSELMQSGFIKMTKKAKKNFYFVEDPRDIKNYVEEKLANVSKMIPELQKIQNIFPYKPKVTFFEGEGGLRAIYNDIATHSVPGGEILSIVGTNNLREYVPKEVEDKYINLRIKMKIVNRMICTDNSYSHKWEETAQNELRKIKIIKNNIDFEADVKIYGDKVAFISYKENYMGVVIESREITEIQKMFFNNLWNSL